MSSILAKLEKARPLLIAGELICGLVIASSLILVSSTGATSESGRLTIAAFLLLASSAAFCVFWFPLLYFICFGPHRPISSRRVLVVRYILLVAFVLFCWLLMASGFLASR
jgi:hypothetical protein